MQLETIDKALYIITTVISALLAYQILFAVIGLLGKGRKFKETENKYKYAILVSARNESKVIGQLIESIKKQDYPHEKIEIFVCAHNCTDNTAQVARDAGATVFEYNNQNERRKCYALDYLLKNIQTIYENEGGIQAFDGYIIFDADNLLAPNYITELNKAFDYKEFDFFDSYRNIKNFDSSFVSSYSSMCIYNLNATTLRSSSVLRMSPSLRGCGITIRSNLLKDGWKWHTLTEDAHFSADQISRGIRSTFVEAAEFFDEQPNTLKILLRQRKRWAKGRLVAWIKTFGRNFAGLFTQKGLARKASCYDRLVNLFPFYVLTLTFGFLYPMIVSIVMASLPGTDYSWVSLIKWVGTYYGIFYGQEFAISLITIIREHKHIRCHPAKLVFWMFFWPFVSILLQYNAIVALFIRVEWKVIPHVESKKIEDILEQKTLFEKEVTDTSVVKDEKAVFAVLKKEKEHEVENEAKIG